MSFLDSFNTCVGRTADMILHRKVILYPTDTVWGLGCDPTHEESIQKIFTIKHRPIGKSVILLVADLDQLKEYVTITDHMIDFLNRQSKPTTVIYPTTKKTFAKSVYAENGSVAIRIVKHRFCQALLGAIKMPIVSTSANIFKESPSHIIEHVNEQIKRNVDYMVPSVFQESLVSIPSQIVSFLNNGEVQWIRK